MKSLSGTAIYIVGLLEAERKEIEESIEKLVDAVSRRRDYDSSDLIAMHDLIKTLTSRYVQLINEVETLKTKLER